MGDRIAEVEAERVAAVRGDDLCEQPLDLGVGLGPRHGLEAPAALDQRRAQTVRVVVQVAKRHAFGADVAVAENVRGVAAHRQELIAPERQLESAAGLAQRADARHGLDDGIAGHLAVPGGAAVLSRSVRPIRRHVHRGAGAPGDTRLGTLRTAQRPPEEPVPWNLQPVPGPPA